MNTKGVSCRCGAVELRITGEPVVQFYCHCDDYQAAHGAAYVPVAIYPATGGGSHQGQPHSDGCQYASKNALCRLWYTPVQ